MYCARLPVEEDHCASIRYIVPASAENHHDRVPYHLHGRHADIEPVDPIYRYVSQFSRWRKYVAGSPPDSKRRIDKGS